MLIRPRLCAVLLTRFSRKPTPMRAISCDEGICTGKLCGVHNKEGIIGVPSGPVANSSHWHTPGSDGVAHTSQGPNGAGSVRRLTLRNSCRILQRAGGQSRDAQPHRLDFSRATGEAPSRYDPSSPAGGCRANGHRSAIASGELLPHPFQDPSRPSPLAAFLERKRPATVLP
jgi:hypothetical protein